MGEGKVGGQGFFIETGGAAEFLRGERELVFDVRFDVFAAVGKRGQRIVPDIDAGEQVFAEASGADFPPQVAVGTGDKLEAAVHFLVAADGIKNVFLQWL